VTEPFSPLAALMEQNNNIDPALINENIISEIRHITW